MRLVLTTCCALACFLSQAAADECRRVIAPTVIAVVAHDNIWTRKADRGMTFRAKSCKVKIGGITYFVTDRSPPPSDVRREPVSLRR